MAERKNRRQKGQGPWSRVCRSNGISQVFEQPANGVFQVRAGTDISCDSKARIQTERHGSYTIYNVSGAVYTILETKAPDGKKRQLFTELTPEELKERGYL